MKKRSVPVGFPKNLEVKLWRGLLKYVNNFFRKNCIYNQKLGISLRHNDVFQTGWYNRINEAHGAPRKQRQADAPAASQVYGNGSWVGPLPAQAPPVLLRPHRTLQDLKVHLPERFSVLPGTAAYPFRPRRPVSSMTSTSRNSFPSTAKRTSVRTCCQP